MKSVPKLIRRFAGLLLLSVCLLMLVNVLILALVVSRYMRDARPWSAAEQVAAALEPTETGYALSEAGAEILRSAGAWAMLIDNDTGTVVWHSGNLPGSVPEAYTLSDIAGLTRGYIDGYPTFTSGRGSGLVVLGFPRDSFWKHMWPSWDYQLIAHAPQIALAAAAANLLVISLIYAVANGKVLRSIRPIVNGIRTLPTGEPVAIRETGLLSEVALHINGASEVLQAQKKQLQKRETARANWIAGVSHDIRTPLSMVMGYAAQLRSSPAIPESERQKAAVILRQSERIRDLVSDLNLASRLEYDMQPAHIGQENAVSLVRQVVVDFINTDLDEKYPVEWLTGEELSVCMIPADRDLLRRALSNLLQNCVRHNENGCTIYVSVEAEEANCVIRVEDDGTGVSDGQIERFHTAPHYMDCDENTDGQRHGLGLLIVSQIAASHRGELRIGHSRYGGFAAAVTLPRV